MGERSSHALLAVGLVVVTTVAIASLAHALVPGMSWGVAFVLGAIISPTDELAAIPVLERFQLPRHVIAIVDGESLLNDATALVIYAAALTVVATGQFGGATMAWHFVVVVVGSIALGYAAGIAAIESWRRLKDAELQGVVSVLVPFLAYFPAQYLQLSGVLAVVTAGIYASRGSARVLTPASRTRNTGFWNTLVFLANALLFVAVGLQLRDVATNAFRTNSWQFVLGISSAVNVVVLIVRFVFVLLAEYAPVAAPPEHAAPDWRHALVVAWSGMRGAISLAAALAIPFALPTGARFPHRDLLIFVTFTVILVTFIGGGLSLRPVVGALKIKGGTEEQDETRLALLKMSEAALKRIADLEREGRLDPGHSEAMRRKFEHRNEVLQRAEPDQAAHSDRLFEAEREVIAAQRDALIEMRDRSYIDNLVFRRLQAELDMAAPRPAK